MDLINRLRVLLGVGDRRLRDKLKLGDRRRPKEVSEAEAKQDLQDLAWIKWKGERKPIEKEDNRTPD